MRRIILLWLVVFCCYSLMACGSNADTNEAYFPEPDFSTEVDELPIQQTEEELFDQTEALPEAEQEEQSGGYLSVNSGDLLSFNEINFLGEYNILSLQTEQVTELLQKHGMEVSIDERDIYAYEVFATFPDNTGTDVIVDYIMSDYLNSWIFTHHPTDGDAKIDLGVRNVAMHDTFAEVLKKIGFCGTDKTEQKLYELVGDTWFPDLENSKLEEIQKNINFSDGNNFFMNIYASSFSDDNKKDCFELYITNHSVMDGVMPDDKMQITFRFERSEETEKKYILTQYSFLVYQ